MFTLRIHSVDADHPLFLSPPSSTNPNSNPDPKLIERRGVVHLFRALRRPTSAPSTSTTLLIVAVPNYFSSDDLFRLFGPRIDDVLEFLIIRNDGIEDRYSVLIRMRTEVSANAFYSHFNGRRFSPPEVEICHILPVISAEFTEIAEIASTPPIGYVELPTCPICLERLDQDTSGIQSTLCDHSFQRACISKWTYLSCQVCRLCQQQDDKPTCSVCDSSESLWTCVICGFVGCGRYKERHAIGHWKGTQHCYTLDLETQRVWDYVGDNYVHRLNHSKADGKSAHVDSSCLSFDGDCGACVSDDSDIGGALYDSKVEAIMDEYNSLLATQLDNQRQYYESLLVEARSRKENAISEAVEMAVTKKMQEFQSKHEGYQEDKIIVRPDLYGEEVTSGGSNRDMLVILEQMSKLSDEVRELKHILQKDIVDSKSEKTKLVILSYVILVFIVLLYLKVV